MKAWAVVAAAVRRVRRCIFDGGGSASGEGGGVGLVDGTTGGIGVQLDPGMQDIYAMPCNGDARGGTAMRVSELACSEGGGWG